MGTVNKENSDTNNQVKDMVSTYGNLKMECSSLYTWLVGETDQNYSVSINTGTNDSTTLQSVSYTIRSLQDMYIVNDSSTVIHPHNTTMYTTFNTVYTENFNSDSQNNLVKNKQSTHENINPVMTRDTGVISITSIFKEGYFSDFKYKTINNNSHKYSDITWEAESMNFSQFLTNKPYIREFGFLPLETIHINVYQNTQKLQEPDMCRWIQMAQKQVEQSQVCNYQGSEFQYLQV